MFAVGIKTKRIERRPFSSLQEKKYSQNLPRMLSSTITTVPIQVTLYLLPAYSPVIQLKPLLIVLLFFETMNGESYLTPHSSAG